MRCRWSTRGFLRVPSVLRRICLVFLFLFLVDGEGTSQIRQKEGILISRLGHWCCGVPFTPTSREIELPEAITSAGTLGLC